MFRSLVVVLLLTLSPYATYAAEVTSGSFSFHLDGEWKTSKDDNGTITAVQQNEKSTRAFILSVYTPSASSEIIDTLLYLRNYLENLSNENTNLTKETDFTQYKTESGAPFDYVAYTDKLQQGFFIGATLGSNSGVVFVTYEGSGSYNKGINELKVILNKMRVI